MIRGGPVVAGAAPAVLPAPKHRQDVTMVFIRPFVPMDVLRILSEDTERYLQGRGLQVGAVSIELTEANLREFYLGNRQRVARHGHQRRDPETGESVDKAGRIHLEGLVKRFVGQRAWCLVVTGPGAGRVVAELFDSEGVRYDVLHSNADAPRTPEEVEHDLPALTGMRPEEALQRVDFMAPARA